MGIHNPRDMRSPYYELYQHVNRAQIGARAKKIRRKKVLNFIDVSARRSYLREARMLRNLSEQEHLQRRLGIPRCF